MLNCTFQTHPGRNFPKFAPGRENIGEKQSPVADVKGVGAEYSISGRMTGALTLYSATFMRYSMAVTPKNYLLFACHFVNFGAQMTQGVRFLQYWKYVNLFFITSPTPQISLYIPPSFRLHFKSDFQTGGKFSYMALYSYGGREAALQAQAQEKLKATKAETKGLLADAEEKGKGLVDETERKAAEVKDKLTR